MTRPYQSSLPPPRRPSTRSRVAAFGCVGIASLIVIGGCSAVIGAVTDDGTHTTQDCAMTPAAADVAPGRFIGGGGGGGGHHHWGSSGSSGDDGSSDGTSSSSSSGGSSGDSSSGTSSDSDTPEYTPGMDPDDVTPSMRRDAESEHGHQRRVGTTLIWFDARTGAPFPWHKKAYLKAKKAAHKAEDIPTPDASGTASPSPCE